MSPSSSDQQTEALAHEASQRWAHEAIRIAKETRAAAVLGVVAKPGAWNFATAADLAIEARLRALVAESFPGHAVLGEEQGGEIESEGWQWIIDPVDGTLDLLTGLYGAACSIALRQGSDLRVGTIADLTTGVVTSARVGAGVTSTAPLAWPGWTDAGRARVFVEWGKEELGDSEIDDLRRIVRARASIPRLIGGAATALVAVATGGGCFIGLGLKTWDIAAGLVVAGEAGLASRVWWGAAPTVHCIIGEPDDLRAFEPAVERFLGIPAAEGPPASRVGRQPAEAAAAGTERSAFEAAR